MLELHIKKVTENIFGQVKSGFLRVSGYVLDRFSIPAGFQDSEHLFIMGKKEKEFGGYCYPDELALLN